MGFAVLNRFGGVSGEFVGGGLAIDQNCQADAGF